MISVRARRDPSVVRIAALAIASIVAIGLIVVRLFVLQVLSYEYYSALAADQHKLAREIVPERGEIFVRDRYTSEVHPVVTNINRPTIAVAPQQVSDAPEAADKLAEMLQLDRKAVFEKISDKERKYVVLARQVPESVANELAAEKIAGVHFESEIHQEYPEGELLAQVLGFVGYDGNTRKGRYGLQYFFDDALAGTPGTVQGVRDPNGIWISSDDRRIEPAKDGDDLILTIDRSIQYKAEEVLAASVQRHGAKSGSVIVVDPKNGAILAMANYPTFDPNQFNKSEDPSVYNNLSVQGTYEPGSIMKPITMAAGLEEGAVKPDTKFLDTGSMTIDRFTIRNAENKVYGEVDMTEVLDESINIGAIYVQQQLGREKFIEYIERFGFGKKTDISLPFEASGNIGNLYRGGALYPATASFGHGITATPLQMVMAYAAIANGGTLYRPMIVSARRDFEGKTETMVPQEVRRLISSQTASTISAMLVSVVENGHGRRAGVPGYYIAGKTGTAQVPYADRAGYDPNRHIGSFAGFGPVDNPAFAMIVKIDEPQDVRFAESTAAPAFGEIAQFILNYYQVPKSR